jgi:hypothetical protein
MPRRPRPPGSRCVPVRTASPVRGDLFVECEPRAIQLRRSGICSRQLAILHSIARSVLECASARCLGISAARTSSEFPHLCGLDFPFCTLNFALCIYSNSRRRHLRLYQHMRRAKDPGCHFVEHCPGFPPEFCGADSQFAQQRPMVHKHQQAHRPVHHAP